MLANLLKLFDAAKRLPRDIVFLLAGLILLTSPAWLSESKSDSAHQDIVFLLLIAMGILCVLIAVLFALKERGKRPGFIRAGLGIQEESCEFRYDVTLACPCRSIYITGHNLKSNLELDSFRELIISRIKNKTQVYLILSRPEILRDFHDIGYTDMMKYSIPLIYDMYTRLTPEEQRRLVVYFHPGPLSFSAMVRDPFDSKNGLITCTPRWFTNTRDKQRMYFAVKKSEDIDVFKELFEEIPTNLEMKNQRTKEPLGIKMRDAVEYMYNDLLDEQGKGKLDADGKELLSKYQQMREYFRNKA